MAAVPPAPLAGGKEAAPAETAMTLDPLHRPLLSLLNSLCAACCLVWFCGVCGVHRCYLGDCCCGVLYLFTGGCCLFGAIMDCCYIGTMTQAANAKYGGNDVNVVVTNNIAAQPLVPSQQVMPYYPPVAQPVAGAAQSYDELSSGTPKYGGFCSSCGARKAAGAKFCSSCGQM